MNSTPAERSRWGRGRGPGGRGGRRLLPRLCKSPFVLTDGDHVKKTKRREKAPLTGMNNVYDYVGNKAFFYQRKGSLGLYNCFSVMNTDTLTSLTINNKYIF